jgi:hypothetical protein
MEGRRGDTGTDVGQFRVAGGRSSLFEPPAARLIPSQVARARRGRGSSTPAIEKMPGQRPHLDVPLRQAAPTPDPCIQVRLEDLEIPGRELVEDRRDPLEAPAEIRSLRRRRPVRRRLWRRQKPCD